MRVAPHKFRMQLTNIWIISDYCLNLAKTTHRLTDVRRWSVWILRVTYQEYYRRSILYD